MSQSAIPKGWIYLCWIDACEGEGERQAVHGLVLLGLVSLRYLDRVIVGLF